MQLRLYIEHNNNLDTWERVMCGHVWVFELEMKCVLKRLNYVFKIC